MCNKKAITQKELKYFTYSFKNAGCLGEMYLLPKIHKRLYNVPGKVPANAILVTANVVGLYPSIPHDAGLKALHDKSEERNDKSVPTADLVNMAHFVLNNNYFDFDSCIKHQISRTTI